MSPTPSLVAQYVKNASTRFFYMPPWSLEELKDCLKKTAEENNMADNDGDHETSDKNMVVSYDGDETSDKNIAANDDADESSDRDMAASGDDDESSDRDMAASGDDDEASSDGDMEANDDGYESLDRDMAASGDGDEASYRDMTVSDDGNESSDRDMAACDDDDESSDRDMAANSSAREAKASDNDKETSGREATASDGDKKMLKTDIKAPRTNRLVQKCSIDTVEALFACYGGSARHTLVRDEDLEDKRASFYDMLSALCDDDKVTNFLFIGKTGVIDTKENKLCHCLLHLYPAIDKSGAYRYDKVTLAPASGLACCAMIASKEASVEAKKDELLLTMSNLPPFAAPYGFLFESSVLKAMKRGGTYEARDLLTQQMSKCNATRVAHVLAATGV